jgi:hypothetical protein
MATTTTPTPAELGIDAAASGVTFFSPNYAPGLTFMTFPQSGTVQLTYGPGSPAPTQAYIYQNGGQTPLRVGTQNYNVNANDTVYILGNAASCKVYYQYI